MLLGGASHRDLRPAHSAITALPPFAESLQWTASDAMVKPASDARGIVSVKDSSIAEHNFTFELA